MQKFLNNKLILGTVGLVLSFLALLQEHLLDSSTNAWILAIIIAVISGVFVEAVNTLIYKTKYSAFNVLSWLGGAVISIIVSFIIW